MPPAAVVEELELDVHPREIAKLFKVAGPPKFRIFPKIMFMSIFIQNFILSDLQNLFSI